MPSRKTKAPPALSEPQRHILALLKAGQPLKTVTVFRRTTATIGDAKVKPGIVLEIDPAEVADLKARGLIEFAPIVYNDSQQFGSTRWYRLTKAGLTSAASG